MGSATLLKPIQVFMFVQALFYLYHWRLYISKSQYKKLIRQYFILNNTFFLKWRMVMWRKRVSTNSVRAANLIHLAKLDV